jgi:hypothetical protein
MKIQVDSMSYFLPSTISEMTNVHVVESRRGPAWYVRLAGVYVCGEVFGDTTAILTEEVNKRDETAQLATRLQAALRMTWFWGRLL